MRLFLIKLGKAINILRRDGLIRGIKRVFEALKVAHKKVRPGDILIITNGVGDSARYRAHHVAEELNLHNLKCSVAVQDNSSLLKFADEFKIFIFHRTVMTDLIRRFIEKIKRQEKKIIFEADDLVYDPKFLKLMDYYREMNSLEKQMYKNGLGGEILNDSYVKTCTTTTKFLAEELNKKGKKVFIVPNKLSLEDIKWAREVLKRENYKEVKDGFRNDKEEVIIGYFSGTLSHNKDFATVTKVLMKLMNNYPQVRLFLAGPLDPDSKLISRFKNRIINSPYVTRKEHFKNIASVDINISPLEIGNAFCESKSELKFFEAGIVRVPTVATATQTFKGAIRDGVDGFVAKDSKEWEEKLERLILDKGLRKKMGEKSYKKTIKSYCTKNSDNKKFYSFLRDALT